MLEYPDARSEIEKNFEFLKRGFGYKGPFRWQCGCEEEYTYINGKLYLNIGFDGAFFFSIGKTNSLIPELLTGELNLGDVDYEGRKSFNLDLLLSKGETIKHSKIHNSTDELIFWANVIKKNSEILEGNWTKFTFKYKFLNYLKTKLLKILNI